MQRSARRSTVFLTAVFAILACFQAGATMVESFNFDELMQRADRIFVGKVTAIEHGVTAEGAPFIAYTFAVSDGLKGNLGAAVTIRQFGMGHAEQRGDGLFQSFKIPSMPSYKQGEELLLLVTAESSIGLSAPVGLFQGAFRLNTDADGNVIANNGSDNVNLFTDVDGVSPALKNHRRGPVKLSQLVDRVNKNKGGK